MYTNEVINTSNKNDSLKTAHEKLKKTEKKVRSECDLSLADRRCVCPVQSELWFVWLTDAVYALCRLGCGTVCLPVQNWVWFVIGWLTLCLPCADQSVICQCVRGLALAPKECAPSWRVHVFTLALVRRNSAFLLHSLFDLFGTDELDQFRTEPCPLDVVPCQF